ncbi:MAG: hypothetical protein AB1480_07955 [Nitrospirota bacterium]
MKKTGVLSFLVFALMFILLSNIAFAQKDREGDFLHIYGEDIESWNEAKEAFRKDSEIILTIYFNMSCKPKQGLGSGMIGFLISKNNDLIPSAAFAGLRAPKAGSTTIPVNFKCGITQASGTIDIDVKGKIIKRGKKKFLRFNMYRKWDCVFKSDLPQYDPLHGKKCHEPSEDFGDYEIPLENGYITNYTGSIYNFALEVINK